MGTIEDTWPLGSLNTPGRPLSVTYMSQAGEGEGMMEGVGVSLAEALLVGVGEGVGEEEGEADTLGLGVGEGVGEGLGAGAQSIHIPPILLHCPPKDTSPLPPPAWKIPALFCSATNTLPQGDPPTSTGRSLIGMYIWLNPPLPSKGKVYRAMLLNSVTYSSLVMEDTHNPAGWLTIPCPTKDSMPAPQDDTFTTKDPPKSLTNTSPHAVTCTERGCTQGMEMVKGVMTPSSLT